MFCSTSFGSFSLSEGFVEEMKLIELDPVWIVDAIERKGMGICFSCLIHPDHFLGVWFQNPIDGGPPLPPCGNPKKDNRWYRTGETFEAMTLEPSINVLEADGRTTHWHGFIINGEVK